MIEIVGAVAEDNAGLGCRPSEWWARYAPQLAAGEPELDPYAHLPGAGSRRMTQATARFRHLVDNNELKPNEKAAILEGIGPRYEWRRKILTVH